MKQQDLNFPHKAGASRAVGISMLLFFSLCRGHAQVPLNTSVQGTGDVTRSPDAASYTLGQNVTLTATPGRYYAFGQWSDGVTTGTRSITIAGAVSTGLPVVLGSVGIGSQPVDQIAVNPNNDRIYIGSGYAQNSLLVVNVSNKNAPATVATLNGGGATVNPVTGRFYSSSGFNGGVYVYNGTDNSLITTIGGIGFCGGQFDVDPTRNLIYLTSQCGNNNDPAHVIDGANNTILAGPLGSGGTVGAPKVNPVTGRVYIRHSNGTRVFGPGPGFTVVTDFAGHVHAIHPGLGRIYVRSGSDLVIRDANDHSIIATLTGAGVGDPEVNPALNRVYVMDAANKNIRVIDASSNTQVGTFSLGANVTPLGRIGIDSVRHRVYVAGDDNGTKRLYVVEEPTVVKNSYTAIFTPTVPLETSVIKQWEQTFGGSGSERPSTVLQTADGGYLISGSSDSGVSGNRTAAGNGDYDIWLVKTDSNGAKQWDRSLGGTGRDQIGSLQRTSDGVYILVAGSSSSISDNKSVENLGCADFWLVKLDVVGNIQWQKVFGGSLDDVPYVVGQTTDGGYVMGGVSMSGIGGNKSTEGLGNNDFWGMEVDESGTKRWEQTLGGNGHESLQYRDSLKQTTDGEFVLAGTSDSAISDNKTVAGFGVEDVWLLKLDSSGNKQWEKVFGGTLYNSALAVQETSEGGFIMAGSSSSGADGDKTSPNRGYSPDLPGDGCWHFNAFVEYRLPRSAELKLGVLNLTDRVYRFNPLNLLYGAELGSNADCQLQTIFCRDDTLRQRDISFPEKTRGTSRSYNADLKVDLQYACG